MRFQRSQGLTPSEKVLAELCDHSFLRLWTYPNLFKKPSKELTDLLVVFGDDVLIFSDKSCSYPNTSDSMLDWTRWYRSSIKDSAHQIDQAERWIRSQPMRVFLDAKCKTPLPLPLPAEANMRVHRICVAMGARDRAAAQTGRPSLAIRPSVANDAVPFTVGSCDAARGWVHVFDEVSIGVVLRELSTMTDFVNYLNRKTDLLSGGQFQLAGDELDLLGYYLWNGRSFPATTEKFQLEPDLWSQVENDASFLAGRSENQVSYFWDGLIEYLTDHFLGGTLEVGGDLTVPEYEQLARLMAGESRFYRRILATAILGRAERAREYAIGTLLPSEQPDVNYVLFIGRGDQGGDHAAYRIDRLSHLRTRCVAAKAVHPQKRYIVGIALDAKGVVGSSEDFMLMDTGDWDAAAVQAAQELREKLGYFMPGSMIETVTHVDEYPSAPS